jgi:integral membrane protein
MTTVLQRSTPATRFRAVAIAEAVTWAGLLVGMVFKYLVVENPVGVQVFGPIHGAVFVLYVLVSLLTARALRWSAGTTVLALVASVPPFGSVVFERWARTHGRLGELS